MAEVEFKPAKVMLEDGEYTLAVGRARKRLTTGELNDAASLRKLVGKGDVVAAVSGKVIVAVGRRVAPCYWIMCYIPVPDWIQRVRPELRKALVNRFIAEGIIDKRLGQEFIAQY
ncbi:MAG TPA: hypothetical protein VJ528_07360 [Geothrix sp.]|nr:hypothetical protein [Geothrix sp.]